MEEIEVGSYWHCGNIFTDEFYSTDVFAKVLAVFPDRIYISRCTEYGFTNLSPASMTADEFLLMYHKLAK